MATQTDAMAYIDTLVTAGLGAEYMEQEIRGHMAHMVPWLAAAWQDSLTKQPPSSMLTWALLTLSARNDRAAYPAR